WSNFGEDAGLAQFDHRIGAYLVALAAMALWTVSRRAEAAARLSADCVLGVTALQILLGILTLLNQAPLDLAALHQATAVLLFASAVWHAHTLTPIVAHQEKSWPTKLVVGIAFISGCVFDGILNASHSPDWSNVFIQIEMLGSGVLWAAIAWIGCYFYNRNLP